MKSNVSNHLELVQCVYKDACAKCPADVSDSRDLMTIRSRVEDEGISFLTITLPSFAKDFETSLREGQIGPACFRSFRKHGAIPAFLQGMLGHVFNSETGRIYDENQDASIFVEAVRQVCLLFKKVEIPCSPARERAALENFVQVEQINEDFEVPSELSERFLSVSDVLWGGMLGDLRTDMLLPRHGPGATAERILGNQKYVLRSWPERLDNYFPLCDYGYSGLSYGEEVFEKVSLIPEQDESPVRVTLVPKTLKGPRIIAIEPVAMQYAQQACQSLLYEAIERHWLSAGHVNFTDQSINQRLALMSSKDGRLATIDLSDASDRVLHSLAIEMFRVYPWFKGLIEACRSRDAVLPDGTLVPSLKKFASMGSALCFPVEAMYFYTICIEASLEFHNLPVSRRNIFNVSRDVYVYGDDIIVPVSVAGFVLDRLQRYNCKVNASKTFLTGRFRESCGVDAYAGEEVTPVYLRRLRPENKQQAQELISWVATANLFYLKGYWRTASLMFRTCERILGSLPYVSPRSSALGRVSYLGYRSAGGWNDYTQSLLVRGWVPSPVYRSDEIDGYPALQKCLLSLERGDKEQSLEDIALLRYRQSGVVDPQPRDPHHLERTARRGAVTLKRRWVPVT